jgi:hypothetical protein
VEAWRDNRAVTSSEPVEHSVPNHPLDEQVELTVQLSRAAVVLRWKDVKSPHAVRYRVRRTSATDATNATNATSSQLIGDIRISGHGLGVCKDPRAPGKWIYAILAVNAAGREFQIARSQPVDVPALPPGRAVLDLPLTSAPAVGRVSGDVRFDDSGATFTGGHIALPHNPDFDLGEAMTLAFEFNARSTDGMPVLLCHGSYGADGWFAQILGGSLIIRAPGGDAVGPPVEPGKWYSVRLVFDGVGFHLSVNGQWLPQPRREIVPKPARRSLFIGRYEEDAQMYAFNGTIRNIRVYRDALKE